MENLLYIVRNSEKNNHSILGVYTSAATAKKAIEYNEKLLLDPNNGDRFYRHGDIKAYEAKKRGEEVNYVPYKEVKVVFANGIQYRGCSAYSIELLLNNPKEFEKKVKEWFESMLSTWSETVDDID